MRSARRGQLWVLGALVALGIACGKEDPVQPGPQPGPPEPTLENIWPNEDGRSWTYRLTTRYWDRSSFPTPAYYDSASLVPPVTLDHAESLIVSNPVPDSIQNHATGIYRLVFDGTGTTDSGATGQRLRGELYAGPPDTTRLATAVAPDFWSLLVRARPDLRSKIEPFLAPRPLGATATGDPLDPPQLLQSQTAWEKTTSYIGSYGDLETRLAWRFLSANLSPGDEFAYQLIPGFANDVFLRCRIRRRFTASTEIGRFENALECLYLIDFGVSETLLEPHQFFRMFDYGTVTYAPTVGPISCYERSLVFAGPSNPGVGDQQLDLLGTGLRDSRSSFEGGLGRIESCPPNRNDRELHSHTQR